MHWELWDTESGNLVGTRDTEAEGLALVRELVGKGWPADVLSLMVEDESQAVESLPPAISGAALLRRAEAPTGPASTPHGLIACTADYTFGFRPRRLGVAPADWLRSWRMRSSKTDAGS